ncbi:MAG: hypothetical protein JNK15_02990 [Planctomycetes bacterium]|nr:hypothetical protein [Planctomycetota bacterium]
MTKVRCSYCGHEGAAVPVHGHGQCERCGTNIEPCCSGANAFDEAAATAAIDAVPDPQLFARLFAQLGGPAATVTTDALLFALVQRLGTDLDDARLVLEAGERLGLVTREAPGRHRLHD